MQAEVRQAALSDIAASGNLREISANPQVQTFAC